MFDVAWRPQNLVVEKSVQRRVNASETRQAEKQKLALDQIRIPRVLPQDLAGYAVDFFFSFYICLPMEQDVHRSVLDCLYPIWTTTDSASPLKPIVTAVASLMLDAWSQVKPHQFDSTSRAQYVQGVAALRNSLESRKEVTNEIIMATLMLDMYENVLAFVTGQRNKAPHMSGTTALIESRRKQPHDDETSQRLILGTRSQVVGRALSSAEEIPSVVSIWSKGATNITVTPSFRLDELNIELANLQSLASQLPHDKDRARFDAAKILERANNLDQRYQAWTSKLSIDWIPTRISGRDSIPQSICDAGLYQDFCDMYKSIFIANIFMSYYSSRIKLQLTVCTCLNSLVSTSSSVSLAAASMIIQELADNICASVPFHLGDRNSTGRVDDKTVCFPRVGGRPDPESHHALSGAFGGFFLIVPLAELLSPHVFLRAGQKQWIGGQMGRIKRICNINT